MTQGRGALAAATADVSALNQTTGTGEPDSWLSIWKMALLPFVLILVQLVCYLKKKKKSFIVFLGFVTCVLGNRFLIILIMSLFSFPPASTSWCHVLWVLNLSNEEMGLVEPDPAVGQLAFSGPFLWEGSRTGFGAAAVGSNRVLGL